MRGLTEGPASGRRVLITAGPTWVRLDPVRHIGNFSSGNTGLQIARALADCGAAVTLLWGPGRTPLTPEDRDRLEVRDFVTFDDLYAAIRRLVGSGAYDALGHAAAVSDYRPISEERSKIPSGEEELVIRLRPTPKIVDEVKVLDPTILLVKFKLEVGRSAAELLAIARASGARSQADLVVANDLQWITAERHPALLVDVSGAVVAQVETVEELAHSLARVLAERLADRPFRTATPPSDTEPAHIGTTPKPDLDRDV